MSSLHFKYGITGVIPGPFPHLSDICGHIYSDISTSDVIFDRTPILGTVVFSRNTGRKITNDGEDLWEGIRRQVLRMGEPG